MFVRIQKLTFSISVNANDLQGLVNAEKPRVLFFNKTKHIIKPTNVWPTWNNFRCFKPFCTRGSQMTQFTNLDIEKNLSIKIKKTYIKTYIFTSNKMLVIHKWSTKYTYKHSVTKLVLEVSNGFILMISFICWNLRWL